MLCGLSQKWYESKVIILSSSSDILASPANIDLSFPEEEDSFERQIDLSAQETRIVAQLLFSSVIYGYSFTYKPADTARGIRASWVLDPITNIDKDDENLIAINQDITQGKVTVIYRYNLDSQQAAWLRNWDTADVVPSEGESSVYVKSFITVLAKKEALEEAIKEAIHKRLAIQTPTKPLEVTGLVRIIEQPFLYQSGEYYHAKVKVKLKINSIKQQQLF